MTAASLASAVSQLSLGNLTNSEFIFIKLFSTSGNNIYSFATFIAFLGPLIGITLGFDAINNERSQGTLIRLASQPIYRDSIINAKFSAGATAISFIVFSLGAFVSGTGLIMIGIPPSVEEVIRILVFLTISSVYICFWLALSIVFSVVCKHSATAALSSISIWIFLSLFMSLVAGGIASVIFPLDGIQGIINTMPNYELTMALNRVSPYFLFSEASSIILDPNVRSIGVITTAQADGAIAGYLTFAQSMVLILPHLIVMLATTVVGFAVAYVKFLKQEIRA